MNIVSRRRPHAIFLLTIGLALCASMSEARAAAQANVTVNRADEGVRVILTHSEPVVYVLQTTRGKLRVRYADPVVFEEPERKFDDRILQGYRLRDDRTLELDLGPGYGRFETFELRHPFRLIFDLQPSDRRGRRGRGRARERSVPERETIIVVDPGHGGIEHGAFGPSGLREKDVTLQLARELKRSLELNSPDITVVLTRDEDRLVGLDERTGVANHNRADLFVSIHLNASPRGSALGAETYFLSTEATDSEARQLAALENQSRDTGGDDPVARADGKLGLVLWDLAQNQHLAASSALAEAVQRQLNALTGTRNRGVRQAPFRVLMGATMPAILVEVGFISNAEEEARFRTSAYRSRVVRAMTAAVEEFLLDLRRVSVPLTGSNPRGLESP